MQHLLGAPTDMFREVINNAKSRLISYIAHGKVWTNYRAHPQTSTDGDELCAYVVPFLMYSVLWPVGPHVVIKHRGDGCVYREF